MRLHLFQPSAVPYLLLPALILSLLLALALHTLLNAKPADSTHHIALTEMGYEPSEITIKQGDVVIFTNTTPYDFWPASNPHPTHSALPSFDPRKPIGTGDSWTYTFTRAGKWEFHDHIYPQFGGVIYVANAEGVIPPQTCPDPLASDTCVEQTIITTLENDGIATALALIGDWHKIENDSFDCHGAAHVIGEAAFQTFYANGSVPLSANTQFCGFGFYHGFMEALLIETGDVAMAQEFCTYVDSQPLSVNAGYACFHGIGHGAVDGYDPTAWGNAEAMMEPGLALCQAVSQTELQYYLCVTGAFDSIGILSRDDTYQISHIKDDPYAFCRTQPDDFQEPCFTNLLPLLFTTYNHNLEKIFTYVEANLINQERIIIDNRTLYEMVMESIAVEFVRMNLHNQSSYEEARVLCDSLTPAAQSICINGIGVGYLKYGDVERGYEEMLAFCQNNLLSHTEQTKCLEHSIPFIYTYFGNPAWEAACRSINVSLPSTICPNPS